MLARKLSGPFRYVVAVAALTLACSATPTEMCGCPPSRTAIYVRGTLVDAAGAPVVGARVHVDGVPSWNTEASPALAGGASMVTDADGRFASLVLSWFGPETLRLRASIVRAGVSDTTWQTVGDARFRLERERPDTVRTELRVP